MPLQKKKERERKTRSAIGVGSFQTVARFRRRKDITRRLASGGGRAENVTQQSSCKGRWNKSQPKSNRTFKLMKNRGPGGSDSVSLKTGQILPGISPSSVNLIED